MKLIMPRAHSAGLRPDASHEEDRRVTPPSLAHLSGGGLLRALDLAGGERHESWVSGRITSCLRDALTSICPVLERRALGSVACSTARCSRVSFG